MDTEETNTTPMTKPISSHSTLGVVIGILIVALVLILGGLYLWGSTLTTEDVTPEPTSTRINREPETPRNDADIQALQTVSNSDELYAIEADLESTNLDTLEAELDIIESEME